MEGDGILDPWVEEVCDAGQPHGFVNFGFPAVALAFGRVGTWLRAAFTRAGATR